MTDTLPPSDGAPAATAPRRPGAGQWIALAAALAVLVAAGSGLAWVAFGHQEARTRPWAAPAPRHTGSYGAVSGGDHYGKLGRLLLPVPSDWQPGPDLAQYGDDATLSASRTTALVEGAFGGLTAAERHQLDAVVEKMHLKGVGLRSYQDTDADETVAVELLQADKAFAHTSTGELVALNDAYAHKGPKVPGHTEAHCYTAPIADHGKLRSMNCLAAEGDLVAEFRVEGTDTVTSSQTLTLIRHQLDRIADPGETV